MCSQEGKSLRKKVEEEFEESIGINKLIDTLLKSFLKSDSAYGLITDIKADIDDVFRMVKEAISGKGLDIYALKIRNEIYLSKAIEQFNKLYEVVRKRSLLRAKKGLMEIWDDCESRILHFLIPSLRRHLPIEYKDDHEKKEIIEALLKSYVD
ncbi:MAG: hypothetical protein QXJ19_06500 [Candidatus Bathyarchaeia archaeon]|nr:hypothetical protein [Candidatus Bathyarchaeota archaeon]